MSSTSTNVQGDTDLANLEYSADEMRQMGDATLACAIEHITSLASQPASGEVDVETYCRTLLEPAPEKGSAFEPILEQLFREWIPKSLTTPGPGFLGYIPGGGLYPAAIADFIQNTTNRFTGIWRSAPALIQLEANALGWIREWMQFPESAGGLFTTGGSMATFNAILCAREKHLGADIRPGVIYTSAQVHHSVAKSAKLAGIMPDRVRRIEVDEQFRMRTDLMARAIEADRRTGLNPFLVVSSAGTTNTGAIDPLEIIANYCAQEGLWHHVDGAYGGFFYMCPQLRPLLTGLDRADSLTLDPHKGLFLPYGTGALLVRDGAALRRAHTATGDYMPALPDDPDNCYDPSQHGPDLSRGFPGLRVWLSVQLYGTEKLRAAVSEKRELALKAASRISHLPGIVMDAPPQLSLFAFHLEWPGSTLDEQNAATTVLLDRVRDRGKILMTGCTAGGRFLARVCVLSFRTRQEQIDTCVQHVADEVKRILADHTGSGRPSRQPD